MIDWKPKRRRNPNDDLLLVEIRPAKKGEREAEFLRFRGGQPDVVSVPVGVPCLVSRDVVAFVLCDRRLEYAMRRGKLVVDTRLRRKVTIYADPRPKGGEWANAILGVS